MRAIRLAGHIQKDHTLSVQLPADVPEGVAEVIVLVPESRVRGAHSVEDFLAKLAQRDRQVRTKEEIDREIELERNSWRS